MNDMLSIDASLTAQVNSLAGSSAALDLIVTGLSAAGPYFMVGLIVLRWGSKAARNDQRHIAIRCGLATLLSISLNQVILLFVHRVRPYDAGITHLITERSSDPSFPSDHATVAFAIAASLLMIRDRSAWPFLILACLVSLSRVYIGTHYLSDIVAGAAIGIVAAAIVRCSYRESYGLVQRLVRIT